MIGRKIAALVSAGALAASIMALASPATASTVSTPTSNPTAAACELVQSEIGYSHITYFWETGLNGCAGDVYSEIQVAETSAGPYQTLDGKTWTRHFDNETRYFGEEEMSLPCMYFRIHSSFEDQSITTRPMNNTHTGDCTT